MTLPRRALLPASLLLGARLSLLGLGLFGCSRDNEAATLRALDPAGDVSVLCLGRGPDGSFTEGLPRSDCPDFEGIVRGLDERHLMLLVTQPANGEVALVDMGVSSKKVVDFEPSQPGYSFLPVGAEPISIVSTPGGVASFVAVRETGREGIFGLPSSCVSPRPAGGALRDLRTWPACRLPTAPGPMALLNDPGIDHDQDASTPERVRERCGADYVDAEELVGAAPGAARDQCPADLASESSPPGRRKLVVTLPSLSEVWVLDAQELLDRAPGSFDDCVPETQVVLENEPNDQTQRVPPDLTPSSPSCAPLGFEHGPAPEDVRPLPVDLALDDENRLYLADSQAPVIHRLDASDPCLLTRLPALHPLSYTDPNAVITTRKVAVSPLTPLGKRFAYAVDNSLTSTAGSLMTFDVSPGATDRTPLLRQRAALTPTEPPDRIQLPRDVADVEFGFQDFPVPNAGRTIAIEGIACDPEPTLPLESAAARYRPSGDGSSGARPTKLRGMFAYAALHSGQLAIVDVEDMDAACRRPVGFNPEPVEDQSGCKNDPMLPAGYQTSDGLWTVSNELSCNLVVPHRARSRSFFSNVGSARSAALLAFPTLTLASGRSSVTDQTVEGKDQPKMLGARYAPGQAATLFVGPLTYSTEGVTNRLEFDPGLSERSSVLLSYEEPRAYLPNEDFTAGYEAIVRGESQALFRAPEGNATLGIVDEGLNASFCGSGVQDLDLTREVGRSMGVTDPAALARFAREHADYVQIVARLLDERDVYWRSGSAGAECGSELFQDVEQAAGELRGRPLCDRFFGPAEAPLAPRDLRIVEASEDRLSVEPRVTAPISENRSRQLMQFVSCCFPDPTGFVIRAGNQWVVRGGNSGVGHHVRTDPASGRCVNDCSPLTQRLTGRVFEISCSDKCPLDGNGQTAVGRAGPNDSVCVVDDTTGGIDPGEPGSECVFQSITTRLAIYRGQQPSARDTRFRWVLSDGFGPLALSLTNSAEPARTISAPRKLISLPELGQLLVTDGTAPGLLQVQISSLNLGTAAIY